MQWRDVNENDRDDEGGFSAEMQKGKPMFTQARVFAPCFLAPPCPISRLQGTRYLSNSVGMMGVINHDDVCNDDANDDVKIMMLTMTMNTNGND